MVSCVLDGARVTLTSFLLLVCADNIVLCTLQSDYTLEYSSVVESVKHPSPLFEIWEIS